MNWQVEFLVIFEFFLNYVLRAINSEEIFGGACGMTIRLLIVFCLFFLSGPMTAGALLSQHNMGLKMDVSLLARNHIIKTPTSTWPIFWPSIVDELLLYDPSNLSAPLRPVFDRVLRQGHLAVSGKRDRRVRIRFKSKRSPISKQAYGASDKSRLTITDTVSSGSFEARLNINLSQDQKFTGLEDSYVGLSSGRNIIGYGLINHWWGSGVVNSLILSDNAPARNGIFWRSASGKPIDMPFIEWLGAYSFVSFVETLDDDRHVKNTKLIGLSFGFRPLAWLEINARRLMQWGGEGRPEGARNFFDMLLSEGENCSSKECKINEPGNQQASIELRFDLPKIYSSVFVQYVGEDEANFFPSRGVFQTGFQSDFVFRDALWSAYGEISDTTIGAFSRNKRVNSFNNHSLYKTGMRYKGSAIGAEMDNDTRAVALGLAGFIRPGMFGHFSTKYAEVNYDSLGGKVSGHVLAPNGAKYTEVSAEISQHLGDFEFEVGLAFRNADQGAILGLEEGLGLFLELGRQF
ncbi:capsule assembly Wzi family protein [Alphaproteobacteria bacterium]|nr:capsule assembly Wzi family protein [Alphaproteobacteria bacterium]